MSPSQVSDYERNKSSPKLPQLARLLGALGATLSDLALAVDAIQRPARFLETAQRADEIREGGEQVLLLREGGMLVPVAVQDLTGSMVIQLMKMQDIVREITLGRALREAKDADAGAPPPRRQPPSGERGHS